MAFWVRRKGNNSYKKNFVSASAFNFICARTCRSNFISAFAFNSVGACAFNSFSFSTCAFNSFNNESFSRNFFFHSRITPGCG
jgi:hypothetical protein